MSSDRRLPRLRGLLRAGPIDLTDTIVVGSVAVLVAALCGYGAITARQGAEESVSVDRPAQAAVVPSRAPVTSTPIDVIASDLDATPIAKGISATAGHPVRSFPGSGYALASDDYASVAAGLDRDAGIVIIVPSSRDAAMPPLSWTASLGTTISALRKAAPDAQVLVVGPVVADAQAAAVRSGASTIRAFAQRESLHYLDGVAHHWIGSRVDATNALPTADALTTAGRGIGAVVKGLLDTAR